MPACSAIVRNTSPWLRALEAALIFAGFGAVPFVARPTVLLFFPDFLAIPLPPPPPVAFLHAGSADGVYLFLPVPANRHRVRAGLRFRRIACTWRPLVTGDHWGFGLRMGA